MKFSSVDSRRARATTIEINEQRLLTIFLVTIEQWIHYKTPTLLLRGNISPLVKDRDGNISDSSNYRAITLSSIFTQMYESLQKSKFGYFLPKSDFQCGFKPGLSTSHAIFCLKEAVDYFTRNNSRIFRCVSASL